MVLEVLEWRRMYQQKARASTCEDRWKDVNPSPTAGWGGMSAEPYLSVHPSTQCSTWNGCLELRLLGRYPKLLQQDIELIQGSVVNHHPPLSLATARSDLHAHSELTGDALLKLLDVGRRLRS